MPRGNPDGGISPYAYASQQTDLASISTMLWGFSPLDNLGRLIYLDTFNNGLIGMYGNVGADGTVALASQAGLVYSPPNAVHLTSFTTFAGIERDLTLGTNVNLGLEVGFNHWVKGQLDYSITYKPVGGTIYKADLRYNKATAKWQVLTTGGTATDIPGSYPTITNTMQQIKMVANWNTGKYKRVLIGDTLIDISTIPMQTLGSGVGDGGVLILTQISAVAGVSGEVYIGYVLITKDEP